MERKIIFRGKNPKNGWIYGDLINDRGDVFIAPLGIANPFATADDFVVDENTVGQFTGLEDKNVNYVYDGDIVKTKYGRVCLVVWNSSPSHVGFGLNPLETENPCPPEYDLYKGDNLEVIGNIHDNPELVEE